jgi:hypothetical protein
MAAPPSAQAPKRFTAKVYQKKKAKTKHTTADSAAICTIISTQSVSASVISDTAGT